MKRPYLIAFLIVLVVSMGFGLYQISGKSDGSEIFTHLKGLKGFDSSAVKGKYFMVHFWAKWCAPCAEEIPHLVDFAKVAETKIPDFRVLAVSLDPTLEESKEILPSRGEGLPSNFILVLDSNQLLAESLGSYQYPETYFYDPQGKVIEKWVGPQKWDAPEVMEYFLRKLSGVK